MNRIDRLLGILLEFQARGELRGEDLARRFEVSVRTIYRDVQALSEMGVPVVATPGTGYRLLDGYFLPPLRFTPAEAALLAIGGNIVRARLDPELQSAADGAIAKLRGVLPPEQRAAVDRWQQQMVFVSFTPEELASGDMFYNFERRELAFRSEELSGLSVFYRDEAGGVYHTYSCYARGDEGGLATYFYLDLTPLGRNETGPKHNLTDWVRHHDRYGEFVKLGGGA